MFGFDRRWWLLAATLLAGCADSSAHPTARVTGKVMYDGQPVTGGALTFSPESTGAAEPGKIAVGNVAPDGSFTLSTYKENDGAVVGKHHVTYAAPAGELPPGKEEWAPGEEPTKSKFADLAPKAPDVEVKRGANDLVIELTRPNNGGM
jgi:hypothetical protein